MYPFLFILLFLTTANGFSFRTIQNHVYTGVISQTIHGVDWLSCLEACDRSGSCVSYNYKRPLYPEDENSFCQLIDSAGYGECGLEDTKFLVFATGFIFHQIRPNIKVWNYIVYLVTATAFTPYHDDKCTSRMANLSRLKSRCIIIVRYPTGMYSRYFLGIRHVLQR